MNDWRMRTFLIVVLTLQFAVWGLWILETEGVPVYPVKQLVALLYLMFVPGVLVLRALRLHRLGIIKTTCFAVGASIALEMVAGVLTNTIFLMLGWTKPISTFPMLTSISILVLALAALAYLRDRDYGDPVVWQFRWKSLRPYVALSCILVLTVSGTILVNATGSGLILLLDIAMISVVAIIVGFGPRLSSSLYQFAIWIISISLLWHVSLVSDYLSGWDIQHEYYLASVVTSQSQWTSDIPYSTNGMLSVVILPPMVNAICDVNLVFTFKVIYPLIFSLVPLGLYRLFREFIDDKASFLSVFLFVSLFTFYEEMTQLARQEIAELFLVAIVLILLDRRMMPAKRSLLLLIFGFGIIVSHYSVSYFLAVLMIALLAYAKLSRNRAKNRSSYFISSWYVALYILLAYMWYSVVAASSPFVGIVAILNHIGATLFGEFLNPQSAQGLYLAAIGAASPLHAAAKYLHLFVQFLIAIGLASRLQSTKRLGYSKGFMILAATSFVMMLVGIAVPYFASSLNTSRLYHLGLLFLAPFGIEGVSWIYRQALRAHRSKSGLRTAGWVNRTTSVLLALFLLFNSGFIYQIANDGPVSSSFDSNLDGPHFNVQEHSCVEWLYTVRSNAPVYSDAYRSLLVGEFNWQDVRTTNMDLRTFENGSYYFFGTFNIRTGSIVVVQETGVSNRIEIVSSDNITSSASRIYSSGRAELYLW